MLRLIYYCCIIFFMICSFIAISYYPDDIYVTWGNRIYQTSPFVMLSIVYILIFTFMLISKISRFFLSCPSTIAHIFHKRNYAKGYKELSAGLISITAQNIPLARKMFSYLSHRHIFHNESLFHLLEAQIALSEKKHHIAREKFEMMLQIPETREFAIYNLYCESYRIGDLKSAQCYAKKALKISPYISWGIEAMLQYYALEKKWSKAIDFLNKHKKNENIETYNHHQAILLTARSLENAEKGDVVASYNDAVVVLKLCKHSIMASICAAKALILQNKKNKAAVVLEKIWEINPHPEIAYIYTIILSNNATERMNRALKLEAINKKNIESLITVAKISLETGNIQQAQTKAMLAAKANPRKGIFLLLAKIERASSNNLDKILYWTQRALYTEPDPLWISDDGYCSSTWLPLSPKTKRLCRFEWKVPAKIPEYTTNRDLISYEESETPMTHLQETKRNKNIKHPYPSIHQDYHPKNRNILSLDPSIRQPDDPGVINKSTNQ
ncbi:heme biosynthesis protein HemY [Candidatus Liberibacter solanacearum]|nr:heme biosynthesis protein HemY [Candidatus Liberibacter solanacearum]KQC49050.1 heme biosynthesis protein HemY [Candidatus Liberibacter solanacearum]